MRRRNLNIAPFTKYKSDAAKLLEKTNWATNGEFLICFEKKKARFFDL